MQRPQLVALLAGAAIAALLIACGGGNGSGSETPAPNGDTTPGLTRTALDGTTGSDLTPSDGTPSSGETPPNGDGTEENAGVVGEELDVDDLPDEVAAPLQAAKEDLAATFEGRRAGEVDVVAVRKTEWPDACLGAPQQGEACAQVITPGYQIVLDLDGAHYTYHTNRGTTVRLARFDLNP